MKTAVVRGMLYLQENPVPIFLTGLMGVGKTAIGKALAHLTQRKLIDTDQQIETQAGMSISEIFSQQGEAKFRQMEKEAVAQACNSQYAVVSLGGGAIIDDENLKLVLSSGILVHLTANEKSLLKRLSGTKNKRPLLSGLDADGIRSKLKELLAQRGDHYAQADFEISTTRHSSPETAKTLLAKLGEHYHTPFQWLTMNLKTQPYPIVIGENALQELPKFLNTRKSNKVFIISDDQLSNARNYLLSQLAFQDLSVHEIPVTAGEALKDIQSVYPIYGELLHHKADRDSIILALGGGSVGDAAGFIAATYMRGIDWVSLPTTLLAQVDSGVGGKTGINHQAGKNLIGAFHQPTLVICDTSFLKTLSPRELISGFGEIVKYAIAFDPQFFSYLETNVLSLLNFNMAVIQHCIKYSLYWKCKMVTKDEFDRSGIREKLNFGHTFGHALESATHYQTYQHGEAIIIGLRFALALSEQRGHLTPENRQSIDALLKQLSVPPIPAEITPSQIFALMKQDKKAEGNQIRFVLLKDIGQTISDPGVSEDDLQAAYQSLVFSF